ncbi:MAG TPA: quinoprotein dehydrogenase-associated putative ABC transporter substrate-binding protein, partial [Rudaea sp.]|nr:quinoprotein dehydrogenase-associated putative ABC transporter substrate-binding protein [Rudaea sp.]
MKSVFALSLLVAAFVPAHAGADAPASLKSLRVCADPGNMPLSNQKGEGFENKIAEVLGKAFGSGVQYYWRPSFERGLMRTTLSEGNCDVWMNMASDTEGAIVTRPLYRSTFVFAYRSDKGLGTFKSMDDPRLDKLRIGVYQVSAVRQALAQHGVMANTVIHYRSHNGDLVEENQPSYQIQQVIDGKLDIAAAWGPMAGYYKTIKHAPLTIQPVNTIDNTVPLEFDMALAVPRGRPDIAKSVEQALTDRKSEIRKILDDYGVPLVQCEDCIVSGNLPSHGPYKSQAQTEQQTAEASEAARVSDEGVTLAQLKEWLANGADPNEELGNAILGQDLGRIGYLLEHGADVNTRFGDGYTPLVSAVRFGFDKVAAYLIEHKADVNLADASNWTPVMYAAWNDDADLVRALAKQGAKLDTSGPDGMNALSIAAQNSKLKSAAVLIEAGADVNHAAGNGGYTPLMLAATAGSTETVDLLLKHGAKVNARNSGG